MNIVSPYPVNIPINAARPSTEAAKRDSDARQLIMQTEEAAKGSAEKGVASESDRAKTQSQFVQSPTYDFQGKEEPENERVEAREQKEDEDKESSDNQQNAQSQDQSSQSEEEQSALQRELAEKEIQLEQQQIADLRSRDREVRAHEQAHAAVGGQHAGSPSYEFESGPDGNRYAVGGEVQIDTAPVPGDPQATIEKMQQVRAAALAPAEPSGQDRSVASDAALKQSQARAELVKDIGASVKEAAAVNIDVEEPNILGDSESLDAAEFLKSFPEGFTIAPKDKQELDDHAELGLEAPAELVAKYQKLIAEQTNEAFAIEDIDFSPEPVAGKRVLEIEERATRIQQFYVAATSPVESNRFQQVVY